MNRAYATLEIKSANAETGIIVGLASTPQTDREGDQLLAAGAKFSLPLPLLFAHDHGQPVGAVTEATVVPEGIRVVAKLALDASDRIREVWALIKAGALRGLSVGFQPLQSEPLPGGGRRFLTWDWFELSLCAVPMNAAATISNIKHFAGQPVVALPAPQPEKRKAKTVTLQSRISDLEQIADGALVFWLMRVKALGRGRGDAEAVALELGAPPELAAKLKAAVAAETTTGQPGLAGSNRAVATFIAQAAESSILMRMLADRAVTSAPMRTRLLVASRDVTAALVGEGQPIPIQRFSMANPTVLEPERIAAAFVATKELLRDTSPEGQRFINGEFRRAVMQAADRYLLAKLTDSGTLDIPAVISGGDASDLVSALRQALDTVHTQAGGNLYWALSPLAANVLALLNDPRADHLSPFGGRFLGLPAVITGGLSGRRLALVSARSCVASVERLQLDATEQGSIEMSDDPEQDALTPDGSQHVSMFQAGAVAIRFQLWLAAEAIRADAAAFISISEGT